MAGKASRAERRQRILGGDLRTTLPILALPILLSGQLLHWIGLTNTYWMGRLAGTEGLAIAAAVAPIEQGMTVLFLAIALGNSVKLARTVGAGGQDGAQLIVTSALFAFVVGVTLAILGVMFAPVLLGFLSAEPQVASGIHRYLVALFIGLPATGMTHVLINSISATGYTQFGTVRLAIDLAVTAGLTPVAMIIGLGVAGPPVTMALTAAVLNILTATAIDRMRPSLGLGSKPPFKDPVRPRYWMQLVAIGLPVQSIRLSQVVAMSLYVRMVMQSSHLSAAGFGIAVRIFFIVSNVAYCLSRANAIVVGQNLGAGNRARVVQSLKWTMLYTMTFCAFCLIVIPMLRPVVGLFSSDPQVIDAAMTALMRLRFALIGVCVWQTLVETYMAVGTSGRSAVLLILCTCVGVAAAHLTGGEGIVRATRGIMIDQLLKAALACALLPISFFTVLRRLSNRGTM